jgi:molecular chaperone DnaK (HSP70)
MNWKRYKEHFAENRMDEDFFVLGVDLGDSTSAIAYFDALRGLAEVMDISGGYGKPSPPTALQYIANTKEWIFGEYAILNANGTDVLLTEFVGKLGPAVYLDTGEGSRSITEVVAIYLRELIANCRNINHKATVAGIVGVVPDFISSEAQGALSAAFGRARYERVLIDLIEERQALLAYCYHNNIKPAGGKILWLDFGARGLRGGLYEIENNFENINCAASAMDEELGAAKIDQEIYRMLAGFYCGHTGKNIDYLTKQEEEQILTFAYGHKDILFNQAAGRTTRLYYNFVHPPFAKNITEAQMKAIITPWEHNLGNFVNGLASREKDDGDIEVGIDVICTGGGFEMPWAKRKIAAIFSGIGHVHFYKNPKGILAQGATFYAAQQLSLLTGPAFEIADSHKLPWDIGINVEQGGKSRFYPLMEKGSWLWQKPRTTYLIPRGENPEIELFIRDPHGFVTSLGTAALRGLPERPPGTTKIALDLEARTIDSYAVKIKDMGFGKIYPSTGFMEKYVFSVE